MINYVVCFFFFQAEDGIRDLTVTGVQTCALPISIPAAAPEARVLRSLQPGLGQRARHRAPARRDRKSTRLNSSHSQISYAVFCLKKNHSTSTSSRTPPYARRSLRTSPPTRRQTPG